MDDEQGAGSLYFAQCLGKTPFETRSDAQKALNAIQRRGTFHKRQRKGKVEIYICSFCRQYHHGTGRRKRRNTRKRSTRIEID